MEDLRRENAHLKKKVKIFRAEMQRKKEVETESALSRMTFASPLGGTTLEGQTSATIAAKENMHLRRLLSERDELCAALKSSLQRAALAQEASAAETKRLRHRVSELIASRAQMIDVSQAGYSDGTDPDDLPMPTGDEEFMERERREWGSGPGGENVEASDEEPASFLSVWSQVLFGE